MAETITTDQSIEPIELDELKMYLRVTEDHLDDVIMSELSAAREWCEKVANRTFRMSVARQLTFETWPSDPVYPDYQPLLSVSSITYYDSGNDQQTLNSANYEVITSTEGVSLICWASTATLPQVYDREDAVAYNYTTGYATNDVIPPLAKKAIRELVYVEFNRDSLDDPAVRVAAARQEVTNMLSLVSRGTYR